MKPASSGDRDAEFTEFGRSASKSLSWTAYLLTGEKEAAAELLQEALVKTYLAWPRVRHGEAARAEQVEPGVERGARARVDRQSSPRCSRRRDAVDR